jgi:hypothetical protein
MLLEVPIVSVAFPMTSTALLLEVPTAAVMSTVPDPAAMVESSVEAATSIHHL